MLVNGSALLLTTAILFLPAQFSYADDIKICFESWEPFHFTQDNEITGIQVELTKKAFSSLGHTVSFKEFPYARCLKSVQIGDFDAIMLTQDEEPLVPTTVTAVFWEAGFVARPDWPDATYTSLENFNGKKAGLVSAYDYGTVINEASRNWDIKPSRDAISNLRKLSVGRIDFTLVDLPWAQMVAQRESLNLKILSPTFLSTPQYVFFNKDKSAYASLLSIATQNLIDDGTANGLYQSFLSLTYKQILERNKAIYTAN